MIPNVQSHSNSPAHSNQDQFYLLQQQSQQQQQFNPQNQQQIQFQQQQRLIQQQPPQNQHHQSLASHFHLLHVLFLSYLYIFVFLISNRVIFMRDLPQLVENLSEVIDNGSRDQQSDALVCFLSFSYFIF